MHKIHGLTLPQCHDFGPVSWFLSIRSWQYPRPWIVSSRFMKNHESKNSLLTVTIWQPWDGYFKWWKVNLEDSLAFFYIQESQPERELISSTTVSEQCLRGQQQPTYREGFLYLQVEEGNNFIIGLTSKKPISNTCIQAVSFLGGSKPLVL